MDYSHFSILLLLLSLALLVTEVFIPSGGVLGVLTVVALLGSIYCAYEAWWGTSPTAWWIYVASVVFLIPSVLVGAFAAFPHTPFGKRVLLEAPTPEEIQPYAKEREELAGLVGKRGESLTPHAPGGMVIVNGRRYHSETRGLMLDPKQEIEVVSVSGNRLVVRLADSPAPPSQEIEDETPEIADGSPEDTQDEIGDDASRDRRPDGSSIDFDLPETS
ncbi:NfeD family protein [Stratiformator vulcanicus]|uniref:Uncharacterized protein n=1 Tax=Stratiformator vulcanicus TaxID=2527980 RepID=A0A517R5G9_9PLAN|nr:NfeD family protein [Stratiformator vulcanicus]QDT39134.1 hypothetical protein Pan189_35370 [Stratiformator vulcanicus]